MVHTFFKDSANLCMYIGMLSIRQDYGVTF